VLRVVTVLVVSLKDLTQESLEEQEYRDSILRFYQGNKILDIDNKKKDLEIQCPIKTYTVKSTLNDKAIKRALADRMAECWRTWYKGELELFSQEGSYCHVCYYITFEDKNKEVEDLALFMHTQRPAWSDLTYEKYLTPFATQSTDKVEKKLEYYQKYNQDGVEKAFPDLTTSNDYAVVFVYAKGLSAIDAFLAGKKTELLAGGTFSLLYGGMAMLAGGKLVSLSMTVPFLSAAGPAGWVVLGVGAAGAGMGGLLFWLGAKDDNPDWMSAVILTEYNTDKIQGLGCEIAPARLG
jgi:hypothetical protein